MSVPATFLVINQTVAVFRWLVCAICLTNVTIFGLCTLAIMSLTVLLTKSLNEIVCIKNIKEYYLMQTLIFKNNIKFVAAIK